MPRPFIIALVLLLNLSCNSGSETDKQATQSAPKPLTDASFLGKTFGAALPDTSSALKGLTDNELLHMSMQYVFDKGTTGSFNVKMNGNTQRTPFTWQLKGDTLLITHKGGTDRLRVTPQPDGYELVGTKFRVILANAN